MQEAFTPGGIDQALFAPMLLPKEFDLQPGPSREADIQTPTLPTASKRMQDDLVESESGLAQTLPSSQAQAQAQAKLRLNQGDGTQSVGQSQGKLRVLNSPLISQPDANHPEAETPASSQSQGKIAVSKNLMSEPPADPPGTPQAPGKLRVINQGLMNVAENNIQTPAAKESSAERDGSADPQDLTVTTISDDDDEDAGAELQPGIGARMAGKNVIQTPLSANQLAWLTSRSRSRKPAALAEVSEVTVPVEGGTWTLQNPLEDSGESVSESRPGERQDSGKNWTVPTSEQSVPAPVDDHESKSSASVSQDLQGTSASNWHLLASAPSSTKDSEKEKSPETASRRRSHSSTAATPNAKKKGDLEVRKDLTMPTAPAPGGDNVFQSEDDSRSSTIPVGAIRVRKNMEKEVVRPATANSKDYQCVECTMDFSKATQLRRHVK